MFVKESKILVQREVLQGPHLEPQQDSLFDPEVDSPNNVLPLRGTHLPRIQRPLELLKELEMFFGVPTLGRIFEKANQCFFHRCHSPRHRMQELKKLATNHTKNSRNSWQVFPRRKEPRKFKSI